MVAVMVVVAVVVMLLIVLIVFCHSRLDILHGNQAWL